jgi:hypothetical protein
MKDCTAGTKDARDDKVAGAQVDAEDGNNEMEMEDAEGMAQDKGSYDGMLDADEAMAGQEDDAVVDKREREGEGEGEGDSEGEGGRASEGRSDGERAKVKAEPRPRWRKRHGRSEHPPQNGVKAGYRSPRVSGP